MGDSYNANQGAGFNAHERTRPHLSGEGVGQKRIDDRNRNTVRARPDGLKPKDLCMIPARLALALQADGWYLRSQIVWSKPNPMPESVTDRPTTSHEFVYLLAKGQWVSRVVALADLHGKRVHLGQDIGPKDADVWAHEFGVRLASAILDRAQFQEDFGLPSLDAEIWQKLPGDSGGFVVAGLPVMHRASVYASRLLSANATAKEFLCEFDRLEVTLSEDGKLLVGGGAAEIPLPPGVNRYGKTAIAIHDSGEIGELDFTAHTLKFSRPGGCSYFFDQEAVREPFDARPQQRLTANVDMPLGAARVAAGVQQGNPQGGTHVSRFDVQRETLDCGCLEAGCGRMFHEDDCGCACHSKTTTPDIDPPGARQRREEAKAAFGRNLRSVWEIPTQPYPEAHFATYPEELVRRCILAGTSERGCCPECGAPWVREVAREKENYRPKSRVPGIQYPSEVGAGHTNGLGASTLTHHIRTTTTGWRPSCEHASHVHVSESVFIPYSPVPCTVLDPFFGSGTTGLVARKHGRRTIGIELSPSYCELAARRLQQLSLLSEAGA